VAWVKIIGLTSQTQYIDFIASENICLHVAHVVKNITATIITVADEMGVGLLK